MKRIRTGIYFIFPGVLLLAVVLGYPLISLIWNSFTLFDFANPSIPREFIGLQNYWELFHDPRFIRTTLNTVVFTALAVTIEFVLGLSLALLLNRKLRGKRAIIGLFILPTASMPVAVGLIWRYMYNHQYGILSYMLRKVGLLGKEGLFEGISLLTNPVGAMASVIVTDVWEWTPFVLLVLLGGLMSLPKRPYEAAKIDGASALQTFRYVTLPLLKPVIAIALLIRISDAMKVLDIMYVITGGGPGMSTETAHLFAYRLNFKGFSMGYGSAQVVLLSSVTLFVCYLLFRRIRDRGE